MAFSITPSRIIVGWLTLLAVTIAWCIVGLPQLGDAERNALIGSLIAASASLAAAPFFVIGLRHFERGARHAFILVCAGMIAYGISTLQFPILNLFGAQDFWVGSGAALVPFVLTVSLQYFGVQRFGRLMLVKSSLLLWPLVYGSAFVVAILALLIPGGSPILTVQAWLLTIIVSTAAATAVIRAKIAERYRAPLLWLMAGNIMAAGAALHQIATALLQLPDSHWYITSGLSTWPYIVTALIMMRTGYAFAQIEASLSDHAAQKANPVDIVLYVASLASDSRAVDPSLDKVRVITAKTEYSPDTPLNRQQETALADVYKEIENYLTHNDPVLRFDAATLREAVRARFNGHYADSPFWQLFYTPLDTKKTLG